MRTDRIQQQPGSSRLRRLRTGVATTVSIAALATGLAVASGVPAANAYVGSAPAAPNHLNRQFLIGVWKQYPGSFPMWKSLGINTMVGIPLPPDGESRLGYAGGWDAAIARNGLFEAREPVNDDASRDPGRTTSRILAWMLPDEPENTAGGTERPIPWTATAALYKSYKKVNPDRPVWLNLIGGPLAGGYGVKSDAPYATWSDWLSVDDYPITQRRSKPIQVIGKEMDGLSKIGSRYEGRMAFIEAGQIALGRPAIKPEELRGEIWEAVVHGARGVIYYTLDKDGSKNPPVTWNNTTPAIRSMMQSQNWILSHLPASVLQGPINPPGFSVTAASPIDTGWRASSAGKYFIVVNTSPTPQRVNLSFGGIGGHKYLSVFAERRHLWVDDYGHASDSIAGYGVHIYYIS